MILRACRTIRRHPSKASSKPLSPTCLASAEQRTRGAAEHADHERHPPGLIFHHIHTERARPNFSQLCCRTVVQTCEMIGHHAGERCWFRHALNSTITHDGSDCSRLVFRKLRIDDLPDPHGPSRWRMKAELLPSFPDRSVSDTCLTRVASTSANAWRPSASTRAGASDSVPTPSAGAGVPIKRRHSSMSSPSSWLFSSRSRKFFLKSRMPSASKCSPNGNELSRSPSSNT